MDFCGAEEERVERGGFLQKNIYISASDQTNTSRLGFAPPPYYYYEMVLFSRPRILLSKKQKNEVYRDHGWVSWADWLGNGAMSSKERVWMSFQDARKIVRKEELRNVREWVAWCKYDQRAPCIPSHPDRTYRDDGWVSWPDWLGYESAGGGEEEAQAGRPRPGLAWP